MKTQYSAADIAAMRLATMPTSERGVRLRADRESWTHVEVAGRGGRNATRREYPVSTLPADVRAAILQHHALRLDRTDVSSAALTPAALPAGVAPVTPAVFLPRDDVETERQRAERDARQGVRTAIERLQQSAGCSAKQAVITLLTNARASKLEPALVAMLRLARDARGRKGADDLPSPRSLQRWISAESLTPIVPQAKIDVLPWYALAVALKQRPQKPTTKWVHEQLVEQWNAEWGAPPSYDVVYRFFRDKFSQFEQLKGQHLGSSLRAHQFYQHRSAAGLDPFVEVHADGWNTHFTAPHPVTGEFVTYEVWHYHCVSTRYTTPPSIGLSESFEVIAKGIELCIRVGGVMAVLQTDSTGSVKNDRMELDPVTSIAERGGITIVHPKEVGNSQANGIAENFNTYLDRESRELATYQGRHMDSLALKRVKKITERMVKAARAGDLVARDQHRKAAANAGKGIVFESYAHAVAWLQSKFDKFNATPHSALPKITDPVTGKRRHQSPAEALQAARDAGWEPVLMDEASIVDLFRPHVRKRVTRGTVSPFGGQRYYHQDLPHYEGQQVQVAIDIMDPATVWVKDIKGRLICEAKFVEATGYRSMSMYEFALEKRMRAQVRRKENQIEQITERMAAPALDAPQAPVMDFAMQIYGDAEPAAVSAAKVVPMKNTAVVQPAAEKANSQYDDITDLAMYLYGDVIDSDKGNDDFEVAVG